MNKKLAITAITLIAVAMMMSSLGSVSANQMEPDGAFPGPGPGPISEECKECDDEFFEEQNEILDEFFECIDDAEDAADEAECVEEAEEDFLEAFEDWIECLEDNACFLTNGTA